MSSNKTLVKHLKMRPEVIASVEDCLYCTVLCMVDLVNSLVGQGFKKKKIVTTSFPCDEKSRGGGQQCSMGNAKFPQTVECFSSLSHNRETKGFQWKIISLMRVCLGPDDPEEKKISK